MSALTAALAVFDATSSHVVTPRIQEPDDSPSSCYSPLPSLSTSASASCSDLSLSSIDNPMLQSQPALALAIAQLNDNNSQLNTHSSTKLRPNEHMAVLLPQRLWKPDALASRCDNFMCSTRFSTFALRRKHHCRKCGGIFCGSCSMRTTPLLDTSNLAFLHPPRNTPISKYNTPQSPVVEARVCDDCWDQVHGNVSANSSPRIPDLVPSSRSSTPSSSNSSSSCSIASTSILGPQHAMKPRSIQGQHRSLPSIITPAADDRSYGELDAYPLKRSSAVCKALGGGRWTPTPTCQFVSSPDPISPILRSRTSSTLHAGPILSSSPPSNTLSYSFAPYVDDEESEEYTSYSTITHVPGTKPRFQLDMERAEEAQKRRAENPVVKDGDFQYRFGGGAEIGDSLLALQVRPERRASTF